MPPPTVNTASVISSFESLSPTERGNAFIRKLQTAFTEKVAELGDGRTQETLIEVFKVVSEHHRGILDSARSLAGGIVFTPDFTNGIYSLVNITEESFPVKIGDKQTSFHPRMLLWTHDSPAHLHPANGHLQPGEVSCAYYQVTEGSLEARYKLAGADSGKVTSVAALSPGELGIDNKGTEFVHKYIPSSTAVLGVYFIENGNQQPVNAITFNLYNAAQKSQKAPSKPVNDTNEDLTRKGTNWTRNWSDLFPQIRVTITENGSLNTSGVGFFPATGDRLAELRKRGTVDEFGWRNLVTTRRTQQTKTASTI